MKQLRITIGQKTFDVTVEVIGEPAAPATPAPVSAPVASASVSAPAAAPAKAPTPRPAASGAGTVVAPLAGKIVSLSVAPGQAVKEGDTVVTIEAMKMNTYVYAPASGTVSSIAVKAGDAVEEGQALVVIG